MSAPRAIDLVLRLTGRRCEHELTAPYPDERGSPLGCAIRSTKPRGPVAQASDAVARRIMMGSKLCARTCKGEKQPSGGLGLLGALFETTERQRSGPHIRQAPERREPGTYATQSLDAHSVAGSNAIYWSDSPYSRCRMIRKYGEPLRPSGHGPRGASSAWGMHALPGLCGIPICRSAYLRPSFSISSKRAPKISSRCTLRSGWPLAKITPSSLPPATP